LKLKYKHLSFSIEVDNYFSIVYSQYLQSLEDTDSKSRKAQIALTQALKNLENIINQIKNFLDNTLTTQSPNLEQTLQNYKIDK
jgi:phosphate uptake regulator